MAEPRRVVLIGKSGSGKSSLANTLFGEAVFKVNHSSNSKSKFSEAQTRTVNGRALTLIDTPGIFDTDRTEEEVEGEIHSCYIQSAPGPHSVLLVLLIEKFTEQEQAVVDQIQQHFGRGVFPSATVVFTHGDQLQEGTSIMDFVGQSDGLRDLVQKCGDRCHVIDNKYWKNSQDPYRSNSVQVEQILKSIEITVRKSKGSFFSNDKFKQVDGKIQKEQNHIRNSEGLSMEESRQKAKDVVLQKFIAGQKRRRFFRFAAMAGLSIASLCIVFVFGPKIVSYFRGRATSEFRANVASTSSVMEVVQEVVAPIKSTFEYIIEAIEAVFVKETQAPPPPPPNETLTEIK